MNDLPVREIVLYKHGVGFFVRRGRIHANLVQLHFRQDEINDVLKSLAVFDRAGGKVLGLHYQTPKDKAARLASSSIRLSDTGALRDLIRDLRGRRVKIVFETALGTPEIVIGRIMGIDEPQTENETAVVLVRTESSDVRAFELRAFRSVTLEEESSNEDLSYFLETSISEDDRRTVYVRLSDDDVHDLFISYVAPSATWRVTYRIVAESDESNEAGKALLQGWGLFDNRLEEDLEDIKVTLVAGQPISFVYDLYASKIPQRPTIDDEARVAPSPVEYDPIAERLRDITIDDLELSDYSVEEEAMAFNSAFGGIQYSRDEFAQANPSQAAGRETGEFFQYEVTTPVSVKRGESALVPIISKEVSYTRELLYNGEKLPNHPVVSLRFLNDTELTLERGPITVVEDNDYKGEAVMPFTRHNNPVYLPYAVELSVRVTERQRSNMETRGLKIEDEYIILENYNALTKTYIIENNTHDAVQVTVEAFKREGYDLYDTRPPDSQNAREMRWQMAVPAQGGAEFTYKERQLNRHRIQLRNLRYQELDEFLENKWLDQATFDQLRAMLETVKTSQEAQRHSDILKQEREALYKDQEQIRANMQALQTTGPEAEFRNRLLGELEEAQNRLREIAQQLSQLSSQINTAEAERQAMIDQLTAKQ